MFAVLSVLMFREIRVEGLEWNPRVPDDAAVVGVWQDWSCRIVLSADHTFSCQTFSQRDNGIWTRDDYNLSLHGRHGLSSMRFVQMFGCYRLMTHPPDDADAWDGDAGLWQAR